MTNFVTTDVPGSIDTVEELVIWGLSILNEIYPDKTIIEAPGRSNRQAECAPFFIDASSPAQWVMIGRIVVPMNSTWRQSGKPWSQVARIGTSAIPAGYKQA